MSTKGLTIVAATTTVTILMVIFSGVNAAGRALEEAETNRLWYFYSHVNITNKLSKGMEVNLHCKSKDDDLGQRVLYSEQSWDWTFHVNFWETTLYFCGIQTPVGSVVFDAFNAKRDIENCPRHCHWLVKDDGVYQYIGNHFGNPYESIPWKN